MRRLALFLGTGAGTGYAPVAPGTFGTLPGLALAPLFAALAVYSVPVYLLALAAAVAVAIWAAGVCALDFGQKDPSRVVIDEVVGFLVAVAFLPTSLPVLVLVFLLFRAADIAKPWPCRPAERLPGGLGIVADDLMAGVYANIACRAFLAFGLIPGT